MATDSGLPPRYEIRVLELQHLDWAKAIVVHSNMFHSPFWPVLYPEGKRRRMLAAFQHADYLCMHQIASGHSLGVFDREYQFRRPESASTGGKLYWDLDQAQEQGGGDDATLLLEQMDFPLVSVALAYDGADALDLARMGPIMEVLPAFGSVYGILMAGDTRDPDSWQPRGPREVLMRNATSTRHDYEGRGLMKAAAHFMMRKAADDGGFRGIQIEAVSDAVFRVWSNPPAPFRGQVVTEFDADTYAVKKDGEGDNGELVYPFRPAKQHISKIYVTLK